MYGLRVLEREPWPDGVVLVWLESPFPYERKPFVTKQSFHQETVPLASLIGTQKRVTAIGVEKYLRHDGDALPMVYRTRTGLYIADGHHRLVAARIRGEKTAIVRVIDSGL